MVSKPNIKIRFIILGFLFSIPCLVCGQINNAIFEGSNGDGYDGICLEKIANNDIFQGGFGDGYDCFSLVQNTSNAIFGGTVGDGYDAFCFTQLAVNSIFAGTNGDGYDAFCFEQAATNSIFSGSMGDGYDALCYEQLATNNIFSGSQGDGYDLLCFEQLATNSIFSGSLGDGYDVMCFEQLATNSIYGGSLGDGYDANCAEGPIQSCNQIAGDTVVCEGSVQVYLAICNNVDIFNWSVPPGWIIISGQGTNSIHVIVGTASGSVCVAPSTISIGSVPECLSVVVSEAITLTTSKSNITCLGANDGTASVAVGGGTAPYSYAWNTSPVQTTAFIQNLTAGLVSVIVTDNNGCSANMDIEIRDPDTLVVYYIPTHMNPPGSATGEINILIGGGVAPYMNTWSNGATTEDIINVLPGVYFSTVHDKNGCAVMTVININ